MTKVAPKEQWPRGELEVTRAEYKRACVESMGNNDINMQREAYHLTRYCNGSIFVRQHVEAALKRYRSA